MNIYKFTFSVILATGLNAHAVAEDSYVHKDLWLKETAVSLLVLETIKEVPVTDESYICSIAKDSGSSLDKVKANLNLIKQYLASWSATDEFIVKQNRLENSDRYLSGLITWSSSALHEAKDRAQIYSQISAIKNRIAGNITSSLSREERMKIVASTGLNITPTNYFQNECSINALENPNGDCRDLIARFLIYLEAIQSVINKSCK